MSENPYKLAYNGIPDEVERRQYFAWQQGHDSRDAEVAALKAENTQLGQRLGGTEFAYELAKSEIEQLAEERDAAIREVGEANRALGALQVQYEAKVADLKAELVRVRVDYALMSLTWLLECLESGRFTLAWVEENEPGFTALLKKLDCKIDALRVTRGGDAQAP